ncbi:oxidoreductase family, NAD-binding rossmann fold domain-containing protein [Hirsutella rhossiliensis]|uniref:Oxidoreductase family, NAD-binding rossmann fold domain-containing protein n=1 Tax=Hirsutella rhossiliensis TaxID=111463 RepID=A0A9P8N0Q7_9HYPO|nr:oxidoreductase family, NAD-binding rossmann fold domain-containing protein [Hirsutella rhossiliensis]KAH0964704.1 oxidoreductase family, NAD-binding rossmann fold domain-containing protein [Hirsutella rhossiliensis]
MTAKVFNVGVVGYGLSAKVFHIPFIATTAQLQLHSIVQRSPKQGSSAPQDHPEAKHYSDVEALLADADVDVVVITTPPDTHFALTKAALEAGKHVLTEKPFVPTSAQADQLIALARDKKRLICVYQNRRWDSDFLTVKHLLANKALGRIVEFNTHFDRYRATAPANWKGELGIPSGGSALFDLGTHLVDQVYVLFGMPQAVHGRLLSQRYGKADLTNPDSVSAELTYPDGMLVHVRMGVLSAETIQPRFWVRGSRGSFHKVGLDPQEDQLRAGGKPTDGDFGKEDAGRMRLVLVGDDNSIKETRAPELEPETYKVFYAAFGKAVESGAESDVPVKATEARDVLRILEAIIESAKTGRDVCF